MKNRKSIYTILSLIIAGVLYFLNQGKSTTTAPEEQVAETTGNQTNSKGTTTKFNYLPTSTTGQIISHEAFSLSYNELYEQAEWVAYSLDKKDLVYTDFDRPFFIDDPKVLSGSANYKNYKNSGYDRGHLCPAADRKYTYKAFKETFYTSNISPQKHDFNAGVWNRLEQKVRYWTKKYEHLYVVTGGILTKDLKDIGKEDVAVPKYFYKILLDYTQPEIKAIAFLIPAEESKKPLYEFVTSIDAIEKQTGINFFPDLEDGLENRLEASSDYKAWSFR